jgi:hypothetical protein
MTRDEWSAKALDHLVGIQDDMEKRNEKPPQFNATSWAFIVEAMATFAERAFGNGYDEKSRQISEGIK